MPCYQVNLISLEFSGKSIEVLKRMGALITGDMVYLDGVSIDLKKGIATAEDNRWSSAQERINAIKRKYSATVVEMVAKKKSWSQQKQGQKIVLTKW
jgi:hypothetical protein